MKPRHFAITALIAAAAMPTASAVSPLITDDADTVPHGEFELVLTFEHQRLGGGERLNPLLFTLTYGLHPQIEVGVESGWIWNQNDNSVADTTLAAKWKHTAEEDPAMWFALGFQTKLPTASSSKDLGSGDPNFSLTGMLTFRSGPDTEIDVNLGYTSIDNLKLSRHKDELFLGIAARHAITETFTAVGEFVVTTAADSFSGSELVPRLGFQWEFNDAMFLDAIAFQGVGGSSAFRGASAGLRLEF